MIHFREGIGGQFLNTIIQDSPAAVYFEHFEASGAANFTQESPQSYSVRHPDYLYFSPLNVMWRIDSPIYEDGDYTPQPTYLSEDPQLANADPCIDGREDARGGGFDPRPRVGGAAYRNIDRTLPNDGFFDIVDYKGAFGQELWLRGWSWWDEMGKLPKIEDDVEQEVAAREADATADATHRGALSTAAIMAGVLALLLVR